MKINNLKVYAIEQEEIGSIKDNDQYFHQLGYADSTVATFNTIIKDVKYDIEIVCSGLQQVYVNYDEDDNEKIIPIGMQGNLERLRDNPKEFLKALELERKSEEELFLSWGNNCWLVYEVYQDDIYLGNSYDNFGQVYSEIKEVLDSVCDRDILQINNNA